MEIGAVNGLRSLPISKVVIRTARKKKQSRQEEEKVMALRAFRDGSRNAANGRALIAAV